jgi:3-deoxy-D-arabino-heptulosonate 7-phosphate (DAHP) synthase class II
MLEGCFRAAATLNLIRAFMEGGFAGLDYMSTWEHSSKGAFPVPKRYRELVH